MKREIRAASNQRAVFGSNRSLGNLRNNGKTSKIETPDQPEGCFDDLNLKLTS